MGCKILRKENLGKGRKWAARDLIPDTKHESRV
jgi:hypothetical protein